MSERMRLQVTIHLSETEDETRRCLLETGKTPVGLAVDCGLSAVGMVAAHCVHLTDEDIALLKTETCTAVHCPASNLHLSCGVAPVTNMVRAGCRVALGTDGAASAATLDMFETMRLTAMLQKGLTRDPGCITAYDVLRMATVWGAQAIGLQDCGRLVPGAKADIVAVRASGPHMTPLNDPVACLVYCARPSDVDLVMIDGKMVLERGRLTIIDENEVVKEAAARARRLMHPS